MCFLLLKIVRFIPTAQRGAQSTGKKAGRDTYHREHMPDCVTITRAVLKKLQIHFWAIAE
jgi:hypothetical protein